MDEYKIETAIERIVRLHHQKLTVTTYSWQFEYDVSFMPKWGNCLYLNFKKSDYPHFLYPELRTETYGKVFDYYKSSFAEVEFHGGITFYQEKINQDGETIVKVGCDYQHLWDEEYGHGDSGERIIRQDMMRAVNSFLDIYKRCTEEDNNASFL